MKKQEEERRSFLKHILAGSAVAVGTAAVVKPVKAGTEKKLSRPAEILYHESESFKKYYKTLR